MSTVLLSNPGLPLAVYGNPGRKLKRRRLRNPPFEYTIKSDSGKVSRSIGTFRSARQARIMLKPLFGSRLRRIRLKSIVKKGGRKAVRSAKRKPPHKSWKKTMATKTRHRRIYRRRTFRKAHKGFVKILRIKRRARSMRKLRHPAVSWSGRRGTVFFSGIGNRPKQKGRGMRRIKFTNPKHRKARKSRRARRNPGALSAYVGGITSAPGSIFKTVKSFNVKQIGVLAGGALATYFVSGLVSGFAKPYIDKALPASLGSAKPMIQRVIGAALPYSLAFLASKTVLKKSKYAHPLLLGGAAASLVELVSPGLIGTLLAKVGLTKFAMPAPVQGLAGDALAGPTNALCGYVEAPSYSGVGGYVEAPSYSGVGDGQQLAGYVEAPSYSGVGEDQLAGFLDTNYMSTNYIDAT